MKPLLLTILISFLIITPVFAQDDITEANPQYLEERKSQPNRNILDDLVEVTIITEREQMKSDLEGWTDQKLIESLSQAPLVEKDIKRLYQEFRSTIVNPPNPDVNTEYSIENAEESLIQVEQLGRKMHNIFLALSDEDYAKYGKLIGIMREVLYIDWKHIPYAIRRSNARGIYWYELHNIGLKQAEEEYSRLFEEGEAEGYQTIG